MKKILALLIPLLILCSGIAFGADQQITLGSPKGVVDDIAPDMLSIDYTPDSQNVYWDEKQNSVVKRNGSIDYLGTPLADLQWIRRLYEYDQIDGDKYLILNSSSSIYYSLGDGNTTSIANSKSSLYNYNFSTGDDQLLGTHQTETPFDFNGTSITYLTIANSTNVPVGRYNVYWHNRWWIANVAGLTSRVYYSEVNDHRNFDSSNLNYINLNVADGQQITGLFISNDKLICTKERSTWEIYSAYPPDPDTLTDEVFEARAISFDIGCLYQSSMLTYQGSYPMWISHRGIELYDGKFNLVSKPIDNLVKNLRQLDTGTNQIVQTTASDWGAGTGVNIDTTTYLGSVAISNDYSIEQSSWTNNGTAYDLLFTQNSPTQWHYLGQSFRPQMDCLLSSIDLKCYYSSIGSGFFTINIVDSGYTTLATSTYTISSMPSTIAWKNISFDSIHLLSEATYYITISTITGTGAMQFAVSAKTPSTYTRGGYTYQDKNFPYDWAGNISATSDIMFRAYLNYSSASYTTQSLNAGSSWGTWGNFYATDVVPSDSTLNYYIVTSTSLYNLGTNAYKSITTGQPINSADGPYAQIVSSFSRTSPTAVPKLEELKLTYSGATTAEPLGISYKDRAYFAVDNGSGYNDLILCYDTNGQWTKLSGNWGSGCVYKTELLTGDSTNTGKVYKNDVAGIYTDSGSNYAWYWQTPVMFMDTTINEKLFKELWVTAKNEASGSIDISYKLYGDDASYTTFSGSLDLYSSFNAMKTALFRFPTSTKSNYIQIKLGATNAYPAQVRRLDLFYEVLPLRR